VHSDNLKKLQPFISQTGFYRMWNWWNWYLSNWFCCWFKPLSLSLWSFR